MGGGFKLTADSVEQFDERKDYFLRSFPLHFLWDYRNDKVDATKGGAFYFEFEPFEELDKNLFLTRDRLRITQIFPLLQRPITTFSLGMSFGSIQGVDLFDVPADVRFYAGGTDTVRGYPYQTVGPLLDGDPTGGRSLFTVTSELCIRIVGPIGWLLFLDGGNVFEDSTPDLHGDLLWGAGTGIRIFSPVGLIGVEVGFPLDRRDGDDAFQFYITLGFNF